ncbi:hypothetical protein ACWGNN_31145 [Streptomyces sp. NPDC055817]
MGPGYVPSSLELEARRMQLLGRVREWEPLFRPDPTPEVTKRLDKSLALLQRWLERPRGTTIPATIEGAADKIKEAAATLQKLGELLTEDEWPVRVTVDTNMLLDDPDVAIYTSVLGKQYMVHLFPVVLRERDYKKRRTGGYDSTIPLPLEVQPIRQALESADPARVLLCALTAFHGLHVHQLRHLKLTDLDDGRLTIDDRVIVLAAPARDRLTAYSSMEDDRAASARTAIVLPRHPGRRRFAVSL